MINLPNIYIYIYILKSKTRERRMTKLIHSLSLNKSVKNNIIISEDKLWV